jgi:UMF1 family MFS transporter
VTDTQLATNDRREIFGWMIYDWANSAFFTVVIGVLIGPYLLNLSQVAVGEDGVILDPLRLQGHAQRPCPLFALPYRLFQW